MNIPAPGGSVGPKGFAVYVIGGAILLALAAKTIDDALPDKLTNWNVGPVYGQHVVVATTVLLGAAMASKLL
jgi:hypothetical protein